MGAYDNIGGVQHKVSKRYDNINGVWRPVSKRYSNVAGVWRQGYSAAIEWTHSILIRHPESVSISDNSHENSLATVCEGDNYYEGGDVTYTFKEPLTLSPGSVVSYSCACTIHKMMKGYVYINGEQVWWMNNSDSSSGQTTYQSSITLTDLKLSIQSIVNSYNYMAGDIVIQPYGGKSFKLTFLDEAEIN